MATPFQKLLALVALDAAIASKRAERDTVQREVDKTYYELDELAKLKDQHLQAVHDARKAVDGIELEMKSLQQQEAKKKKLIDVANNLKEFNSAKAELAVVQEELVSQEEALLKAWNTLEAAQKTVTAFEATYQARHDEVQQKVSEQSTKIAAFEAEILAIEAERLARQAEVPAEWLSQYNTMHASVADPVVPITDDSCSACFSPTPSQLAGRIKKGAILPCKGCFRLLYDPAFHKAHE
jgi:predicted  nucleic acid-binding Zn-ribbon protein